MVVVFRIRNKGNRLFKKIQNSLKLTFLKLWSHSETAVSETSSAAIVSSDIDPSEIEGQSNGVIEI